MSYNDQESHHLLIWLNRQRQIIGQRLRIYSFQQLTTSRIIPSLLSKINSRFFSDITDGEFDFKVYLLKIEKYLSQVEDLKFKRSQKQQLLESGFISEMVKLVLFLIMRHQIKQEFVNRILQLEDQTQMYLMYQIKKVEGWLQSKMEIKEVLQTIQGLEQENEMLQLKLREIQMKNQQAIQIKAQVQQENLKLNQSNRLNNAEKSNFIEKFGISHPKEYLTIYKDLVMQRNEILNSQAESESLVAKLSQQNRQIQEKIMQDGLIIDHLNQQISKYRQIYCHLKKSTFSQNDFSRDDKQNIQKECSTTLASIKMAKSVAKENDNGTSWQAPSIRQFQQEQPLAEIMHSYQEDLMGKLQEMYVKIGALNNQISTLKAQNNKVIVSNRQKQRMIDDAYEEFQEFSLRYRQTMV